SRGRGSDGTYRDDLEDPAHRGAPRVESSHRGVGKSPACESSHRSAAIARGAKGTERGRAAAFGPRGSAPRGLVARASVGGGHIEPAAGRAPAPCCVG